MLSYLDVVSYHMNGDIQTFSEMHLLKALKIPTQMLNMTRTQGLRSLP